MKTALIHLEPHDDVVSIRDKMSWYSSQRMILIWPKYGRLLNSELDVSMIKRTASSLGSQVAFVTYNIAVAEIAESLGIPVFLSLPAAEKNNWKSDLPVHEKGEIKGYEAIVAKKSQLNQNKNTKELPKLFKIILMVVCFVALLGLFTFIVPKAEITIFPQHTLQQAEIKVTASSDYSSVNPSGGLPAAWSSVEVNSELTKPSTGVYNIPSAKAAGTVLFTNLTREKQTIPAGTIMVAADELNSTFTLLSDVELPAKIDAEAEGQIEAVMAGSSGNVAAGLVDSMIGEIGELVSVSNPEALTGGADQSAPSPSEEDYLSLQEQLKQELSSQALAYFKANIETDYEMITESLVLDEIISMSRANPAGQPADEAKLQMTARFKILTYRIQDKYALASVILNASLPNGFTPAGDEINIQDSSDKVVDSSGQANWTAHVQRLLIPVWNKDETSNQLAGKSLAEAQLILANLFPQTQEAEISLITSWWKWLPFLPTQIHFVDGISQ